MTGRRRDAGDTLQMVPLCRGLRGAGFMPHTIAMRGCLGLMILLGVGQACRRPTTSCVLGEFMGTRYIGSIKGRGGRADGLWIGHWRRVCTGFS